MKLSHKYLLICFAISISLFLLSSCNSQTTIIPSASPSSVIKTTPIITSTNLETYSSHTSPGTIIPTPIGIRTLPKSELDTPTPSKTPIPTQTPTPTIIAVCPQTNDALTFELPINEFDLETSILDYLSAGGDPKKITTLIETSKVPPPSIFPIISLITSDLDLDSNKEIAISTHISATHQSAISIYHCGNNNYYLMHSITYSLDEVMYVDILLADRLFANKEPFLVIRENSPYGWAEIYRAIGWTGFEWETIDLGSSTSSEIALYDQNNDGIKEVFIETNNGSRMMVDTYEWNNSRYELVSTSYTPGKSRIDYFEDAQKALSQGNPLLAIAYYEIAAEDDSLENYPSYKETNNNTLELAKPYQKSFAYYRIVALWFYLGRSSLAHHYIQEMTDIFPQKTPGNEFVLAANELATWYDNVSSFRDSCLKAVSYLDDKFPNIVTDHLGGWRYFGFLIAKTSDICEVR